MVNWDPVRIFLRTGSPPEIDEKKTGRGCCQENLFQKYVTVTHLGFETCF